MPKVTEITKQYLDRELVKQLLSPTLPELFRDYTPKWVDKQLVWFKKTDAKHERKGKRF